MNDELTNNLKPEPADARAKHAEARRFGWKLAGLFLLITATLGVTGYVYLAHRQADARAVAHRELSAIADLKLRQLSHWREERLADARFFSRARFVAQDVQRFLDEPDSEANRSAVLQWLDLLKGGDRYYAAVVFDTRFEPRLAIPGRASEPATSVRQAVEQALQRHDVVITDLHQDQTNAPIHIDIVFPVFEEADPQRGPPIAAVLLRLDARRFLFPLIQSWPTPSQTAETLLVRQEGNEVVYLNDLRHRPGTALALRLPLALAELTAAKALRGESGVLEGLDYRGVPVVAAGRLIPGTSWVMVAKVDREEIYAPLRQQMFTVVLVLGALLVASALLVGLLWHQRNAQFLQREVALERERAALAQRLAHLMRDANDIILVLDPEGRVLEANARALEHYGYTQAEIQRQTLRQLRAPETLARLDADLERVKREGAACFESLHQRKDGGTFPVEVSARRIRIDGATFILSVVRDITERKAHEREIERLNRLYAALSQVNQAVLRVASCEELRREVCRVLVEFGGFQMAWIGWLDESTSQVIPVEQCGDRTGYLQQIRVFADERPEGRGPTGTAVREGRACVFNDCLAEPSFAPWRDAALRAGWRSLAGFPIREEGRVRGALTVYSQQADFFGAKEQALVEEAADDISFGLDVLLNDQRRRAAEEQMRLQAAALESAANAIVITDRAGVIHWANGAFERLTGYSVAEVLGQTLRVLKSGRQPAGFFQGMWETIRAGQVWHGELVNKRKDGGLYDEEMTVTPVRDARGQITHFIAIKQDISERKRAEEALRESEERFRTMADAMPQLAWMAQPDGSIFWYNRRWYEYTGTTPQQMEGCGWQDVHDPQVLPQVVEQWRGSVATGQPFEMEFPLRGRDGRFHPFLTRVMPLKDNEGWVVLWLGTNTDITDIVAARDTLARSRIELERLVAERTAQLVEANANLQAFAYTAAHDLRSPLRGIASFSSIALEDYGPKVDEAGRSMLLRIIESAGQMSRLLDDLLEYSKMSAAEIRIEKVSLQTAVAEALALLDADIRGKNAVVTVAEGLPDIVGHPATVALIVSNLVSNALKFIPPGLQPRVRIWADQQSQASTLDPRRSTPLVRLWVEDNGIGIAAADQEKLFNAFQRLHGKQAYPGTGLGLAIVRKGAERMGGRVGVESEPGRGSRFWVELLAAEN